MSFLNPVNEPVLRFKSTDAGAPQINYNARTAGDVKAVLKACLVTGYGAVASAGWSIVNEVGHVAEFVSPSASMSDYRLGVDDTSASNTTWYYQYQDTRINPARNSPGKAFYAVDKTHISNGWQLLATQKGLFFIENIYRTDLLNLSSRITYIGQLKLAIESDTNLCFFNTGQDSQIQSADYFYSEGFVHYHLAGKIITPTSIAMHDKLSSNQDIVRQNSLIDISSPIFALQKNARIVGKHSGMMIRIDGDVSKMHEVKDITLPDGRPALKLTATSGGQTSYAIWRSQGVTIPLDYWEY